jgi:serine/threonine-protein kinase ULK/ATG1
MYRLIFNRLPYNGVNWSDLAANIRNNPVKFPSDYTISEHSKNLLLALLKRDPFERIGWEEFFAHPYFTKSPTSQNLSSAHFSVTSDQLITQLETEYNFFFFHTNLRMIN